MEVRRDTRVGPSPIVTGVFRVYDVDERPKLRGTSYFVLILAAGPSTTRRSQAQRQRA